MLSEDASLTHSQAYIYTILSTHALLSLLSSHLLIIATCHLHQRDPLLNVLYCATERLRKAKPNETVSSLGVEVRDTDVKSAHLLQPHLND